MDSFTLFIIIGVCVLIFILLLAALAIPAVIFWKLRKDTFLRLAKEYNLEFTEPPHPPYNTLKVSAELRSLSGAINGHLVSVQDVSESGIWWRAPMLMPISRGGAGLGNIGLHTYIHIGSEKKLILNNKFLAPGYATYSQIKDELTTLS